MVLSVAARVARPKSESGTALVAVLPLRGARAEAEPTRARREADPAARFVSEHTCVAVLGIASARYKALIRKHAIAFWPDGKLKITRVEDWDRVFDEITAPSNDTTAAAAPLTGAAALLASIGYREKAGGGSP
jgi:hypothetical protein